MTNSVDQLLDRARQLRGRMVIKDLGANGYVVDWDVINQHAKLIHEANDISTREVERLLANKPRREKL